MRSLKPPHREKTQSRRDFSIVALAGISALAAAGQASLSPDQSRRKRP